MQSCAACRCSAAAIIFCVVAAQIIVITPQCSELVDVAHHVRTRNICQRARDPLSKAIRLTSCLRNAGSASRPAPMAVHAVLLVSPVRAQPAGCRQWPLPELGNLQRRAAHANITSILVGIKSASSPIRQSAASVTDQLVRHSA